MSRSLIMVLAAALLSLVGPLSRPAVASCTAPSTQTLDQNGNQTSITLIDSAPCGVYGTANSRFQPVNGVETQVTVPYMKHEPAGNVKAIVVLLAGGQGQAHIVPDACINNNPPCDPVPVAHAGANFLVRSAQLFAERGFRALTIDQPSPLPSGDHLPNGSNCGDPNNLDCYDLYRQGQRNALDIAAVVRKENPGHKPVFLAGTSRGAESAVAQNLLGVGSMLSSPVTSTTTGIPNPCDGNHTPYVDDCFYGALQAKIVTVPVQILEHVEDPDTAHHPPCDAARLQDAKNLRDDLTNNGNNGAGVKTFFFALNGGFEQLDSNGVTVDPCGAESFHGFLGVEDVVVHRIDRRMTLILQDIDNTFGPDHPPISGNATRTLDTSVQTSRTINLSNLASDADGDALTFSLVHPKSTRSAALSLSGNILTYDASGAPFMSSGPATINDAFVYVTTDGKGRKSFGIIKMTVTVP
jgi:hypothetical protein